MNVILYYNLGADHFIVALGGELTSFLNSPKLGLATAVRLFEMFKDGKISKEETTFVKKCLDELVFEIIEGDLVNTSVYMEVMMLCSFFLFINH
jgi:hypothetical protein